MPVKDKITQSSSLSNAKNKWRVLLDVKLIYYFIRCHLTRRKRVDEKGKRAAKITVTAMENVKVYSVTIKINFECNQ